MNVVEKCIMGPAPQACRCFGTVVASADGLLCLCSKMEQRRRWRRERRDRRRLRGRRLEEVRVKAREDLGLGPKERVR